MTASWGMIGFIWGRPVAQFVIRPQRYTREFVDREERVTLSFFSPEYHAALEYCGSRTGRTEDKIRNAGRPVKVLNLFAYTGTATCYAADGGVEETVTVDLSNTYLDWAERNMRQNGFVGPQYHFVRDDVLAWIRDQRQTRNRWDLIFVDPPTFSNSSKMGRRTWDVQRDHVELLAGVSRLLAQGGHAIFSCNLRGFRPETRKLAHAASCWRTLRRRPSPRTCAQPEGAPLLYRAPPAHRGRHGRGRL